MLISYAKLGYWTTAWPLIASNGTLCQGPLVDTPLDLSSVCCKLVRVSRITQTHGQLVRSEVGQFLQVARALGRQAGVLNKSGRHHTNRQICLIDKAASEITTKQSDDPAQSRRDKAVVLSSFVHVHW